MTPEGSFSVAGEAANALDAVAKATSKAVTDFTHISLS